METANKVVEYVVAAAMWVFAISAALMAVFGGSINIEVKGMWGLLK